MFKRARFCAVLAIGLLALSGCAKEFYDSDEKVADRAYFTEGTPSITLMTMVSNSTGAGGHSALLIDGGTGGQQRIMYDPAGRWKQPWVAERNDVIFGLHPVMLQNYKSFHARDTHHVVSQRISVSPDIARRAYELALQQGASHDAMCAANTTAILSQLPGFESIGRTWYPRKLMLRYAKLPGVTEDKYYENDVGQN